MDTASLQSKIRDVADFPKKGILFKDITPLLKDPLAFRYAIDKLVEILKDKKVDLIAGIESRGFIFAPNLAYQLGVGFVPIRKKGKLPWETEQIACTLEYGEEILEIHKDAVDPGMSVVIIDDLLATGGTAEAAARLIEKIGGKVELMAFGLELSALKGRDKLTDYEVFSLIKY